MTRAQVRANGVGTSERQAAFLLPRALLLPEKHSHPQGLCLLFSDSVLATLSVLDSHQYQI